MNVGLILAPFIAWMSTYSDLPAPSYAPEIRMQSAEELWHIMHPGVPQPENPDDGRVRGLHIAGTIFLDEDCPLSDTFCRSILLHELVHFYQFEAGIEACIGELEAEAYATQRLWLEQRGVNIWDHLDPLWVLGQSFCDESFAEAPR